MRPQAVRCAASDDRRCTGADARRAAPRPRSDARAPEAFANSFVARPQLHRSLKRRPRVILLAELEIAPSRVAGTLEVVEAPHHLSPQNRHVRRGLRARDKGVRPRRGLASRLPLAGPPRRFRGKRRKPSGLRRALGRGLSSAFRLREVEGLVTNDSGTTPGGPHGPPGTTRAGATGARARPPATRARCTADPDAGGSSAPAHPAGAAASG